MDYLKEFISRIQSLDKSKRVSDVFKDFLTLSTCSIAQPFYRSEEIEQKYLNTINRYPKEQAEDYPRLLAFLVKSLEEKYQDFLGQVYMNLNLGNNANSQFFTPYHISKFMAEICFSDFEAKLEKEEFITLSEPCCGSGGMVIALAETMKAKKYNYQKQLFVEAIDIDEMCFMMAYIQLSLYGIPAKVIQGETITLKFQQVVYTPMYFIIGIGFKLRNYLEKEENNILQKVDPNNITM